MNTYFSKRCQALFGDALRLAAVFSFIFTTACTSLFFQPSKTVFSTTFENNITPRPFRIQSFDGTVLSAWYFTAPKQPSKGLIVQFHGNAENMTTHYQSLYWLTKEGYDLITFDYRGYGTSEGDPGMTDVYKDVLAAIDFTNRLAIERKLPLILIGQSLGGSLLLRGLEERSPSQLRAIVIESAFYSYRQIAREKMNISLITKPIALLTPFLVSEMYSPGGVNLKSLPKVPKYLLYSEDDPIVPLHHGQQLFSEMDEPKFFWAHKEAGHINSFFVEGGRFRTELVRELDRATKKIM